MSSTIRKLADKVEQMTNTKDKQHNDPHSSNYGPHSSAAANRVDPMVDSDLDGRNNPTSRVGGYGNTQASDSYGTTTGPGGIASSDTYGSNTNNPSYNNPSSTNYGPHGSNIANTVDPRVDSDRDGRNNPTSNVGGRGHTQNVHDNYGQTTGPGGVGTTTSSYGTHHGTNTHSGTAGYDRTNTLGDDPRSTNAGPHSSNIANKLDPRVDSNRDGRNDPTSRTGGYGQTQGSHGTGLAGNTTYAGTGSAYDSHQQSTNAGPHSSNLMNKLDPRVDPDRDGRNDPSSRVGGYGQSQSGPGLTGASTAGYGANTGHHNTGEGYTGTNTGYDNPSSGNTGPHSSNLLNKLDPRVDSDRDGRDDPTSRTGGYGNTQTGSGGGVARY